MKQRVSVLFNKLKADHGAWLTAGLCLLVLAVAVWHVLDFSHDFDPEFPGMPRDHFSRYAQFAYRLAEPGDTLDLVVLYLSAAGLGLLLLRQIQPGTQTNHQNDHTDHQNDRANHRNAQAKRLTLMGLCLLGFWLGSAPDPTFDGWHGLAWQSIFRLSTPPATRLILALIGIVILGLILVPALLKGRRWYHENSTLWRILGILCAVMTCWRVSGWPDPEPWGYWPRWAMIAAMLIVLIAILNQFDGQTAPEFGAIRQPRRRSALISAVAVFLIIQGGYYLHWLHWPIPRLKVAIPGQLYFSAMPPPKGLALANERHHFKTIINLFNEDTPLRHPDYPAEFAYAKANGIKYVRADGTMYGEDFIESTFAVARNPENWPVLVHCHGNMDRTPAWVGMFRFHFQGWNLTEVLTAIERHRGYRPKGGVSVLYCDVLSKIDKERWEKDPVARRLEVYTKGYTQPEIPKDAAIADKEPDSVRK